MFNKTASSSKKKIRMTETPTKSHTASIHLKAQEEQVECYRLPLKEMLLQRREDQYAQLSQKKIRDQLKLDGLAVMTSRLHKKSDSRSAKKISVHEQHRVPLGTDRFTKEFHCGGLMSKRLRTEADTQQDEPVLGMEGICGRPTDQSQDRRLKLDLRRKKEHIEVRVQDLMSFISQYSRLKARNQELQHELNFYKSTLAEEGCRNSIFKVLDE